MVQQQESFQAGQSSTAYQRAVADMKAAGINPILAAQNGGASTSAGAIAQMTSPLQAAASQLPAGINSAMGAVKTAQDLKATQAQINNLNADSAVKAVQASVMPAQAQFQTASAQKALSDIDINKARMPLLQWESQLGRHGDALINLIDRYLPQGLGGSAKQQRFNPFRGDDQPLQRPYTGQPDDSGSFWGF